MVTGQIEIRKIANMDRLGRALTAKHDIFLIKEKCLKRSRMEVVEGAIPRVDRIFKRIGKDCLYLIGRIKDQIFLVKILQAWIGNKEINISPIIALAIG